MKHVYLIAASFLLVACSSHHRVRETEYHVCAYVWPSCHDDSLGRTNWEKGEGEWEVIRQGTPRYEGHYQPKRPLWGYEMDNDPKVVEKWIDTALSHGINTFIYDWYWFEHYPYLESALDDGFLKAANCSEMDFYIMWANHDVAHNYWNYHKWGDDDSILWHGAVDMDDFQKIVERVIRLYFHQPNYVKIDGCPVFAIFDLHNFISGLGGMDKAMEAVEYMRSEVRKAGFPDVHLQMTFGGVPTPHPETLDKIAGRVDSLGIASMAGYNPGGWDSDYTKMNRNGIGLREIWKDALDIPVFPVVAAGWDDTPRFPGKGKEDTIYKDVSPESFARFLNLARLYADRNEGSQPKFIMINAWNEWIEGSYLLPDEVWGFRYLEAVRSVFGTYQKDDKKNKTHGN